MRQLQISLSFFSRRVVPVVLQSEAAECGLACLAMVASFHGYQAELSELRRRWPPSPRGVTLAHLIDLAKGLHLVTRALRLELEGLERLKVPAILHWDLEHFVVLERLSRGYLWIVDPAIGRRKITRREASPHFTGVALELQPAASFQKISCPAPLPLRAFFTGTHGLVSAISRILVLSLCVQLLVLIAPLFGQIVIDEIVLTDDRNFLTVLAPIFLLLVGIQVCISGARGWLVMTLGANLQFGWSARLFHHLMRLPSVWFERRHMGDIVSRFHSMRAIEALVANSVVEAVVDGLMAVTTVFVMFMYSPQLAGVVLCAVIVYAITRLVFFDALRAAMLQSLLFEAHADSIFMESMRAILALKSYGREAVRESIWQNRRAEAINAELRKSRIDLIQQMSNAMVFGMEAVIILWIGALAILANELTIGMLIAFIAYKSHFSDRAAALIDKVIEFKLIGLHLDRLADIALADREPSAEFEGGSMRRFAGNIEVRNLCFRYAAGEPYIIDDLNLNISGGECVALTGPSGLGKTTLVKLMMGLLEPSSGQILVDGTDLHRGILGDYRRQVAGVMQDDVLLSGTLADNISLFDPNPDQAWLEACAQLAAVHEDIMQMPMGYLTPVGDMGNTLSGGQRQRICLARALYARPRIIFLDEATSHLDSFTEHRVHQAMCELHITRIIVAHRRETLAEADRVIQLQLRVPPSDASHSSAAV